MRVHLLSLASLAVVAFSLATSLEPWFQSWSGNRAKSGNLMQVALGDGRKLFAKHFFLKADAYFHNGYYPTIYDNNEGFEKAHIAEDMHKPGEEDEGAESFLGKPKDFIDAFSRHFFPARHTHLGDSGCGHSCCQRAKKGEGHDENCAHKDHDHGHDDHDKEAGANEREILPWLRLSAELDPERVETYVVSAYWLRTALNKVDEAERFLREGLQVNPGDPEILFELGCIHNESRHDTVRARNLWELAARNWLERESSKKEPNIFIRARILGNLATLEEKEKNYARALEHLSVLKTFSPSKDAIEKWIADVKGKAGTP